MEKTFFIIERIYRMTHIPMRYLDAKGEVALLRLGCEPQDDPITCDASLLHKLLDKAQPGLPVLNAGEDVLYGLFLDGMGNPIILGPVSTSNLEQAQIRKYAETHHVTGDFFKIRRRTLSELCAALALIYHAETGKCCTEQEIALGWNRTAAGADEKMAVQYQNYQFESVDEEVARHNFSVESDFTRHIREGDPEGVKKQVAQRMASFREEQVGKLAERPLKQNEYMGCTSIVLASRAAIEGGLDSLTAYLMSDLYMQRLEKCATITEIYQLIQEMMLEYAQQVKKHREERSGLSYVEQCKAYVGQRLNKRFIVEDIAREIGVSADYLSKQFSRAEKIGIRQYTQKKRVEAACNMLKFSGESLLSISNYLCFNSQSHFGKVFKEHTGFTPQKYRNAFKIVDFNTV